jgi:diaminopimelate decarboxylase
MREAAAWSINRNRQNRRMLDLFPDSARVDGGALEIGGARVVELAERFGTPLVVYCEATLRGAAREVRAAAPDALVVYGAKAFPNVAVMRLFAAEGLGADVASAGELAYALRAGIDPSLVVVHGNNKSDEDLAAAAAAGATVVLDAPDEAARAAEAGVRRVLVRVTLGVEADTHEAIRTGHHGSKFGLPPAGALAAVADAQARGLDAAGLHIHVGSQLADATAHLEAIGHLAAFTARCREEIGWLPRVIDLGGGFGVRHEPAEPAAPLGAIAAEVVSAVRGAWRAWELPDPALVLEPGRALVGRAAVTLYRVGAVKPLDGLTWVAVDGGMSDNPRPQLYGARYTALLANRADDPPAGTYSVAGMHCESGDVLIDDVELPTPRRGDLLAVPATGAYTLAMASNYNGVPRPAVVIVAAGEARLARRRETVHDLLRLEVG